MAVFNRYLFFREQVARHGIDWVWWVWATLGNTLLVLRHPRRRGWRGLGRGYRAVWRHLTRGEMPGQTTSRTAPVPGEEAIGLSARLGRR